MGFTRFSAHPKDGCLWADFNLQTIILSYYFHLHSEFRQNETEIANYKAKYKYKLQRNLLVNENMPHKSVRIPVAPNQSEALIWQLFLIH